MSESEKNLNVHTSDSSAEAVVLFDHGELELYTNEGAGYYFRRHKRIKILKKSGVSFGNIEIPYYTDPNRPDRIISISAQVYNNGVWTELSQKDIYETQINEFWRAKTFSLPKLTE
ncbi:MAG: hypothetical protein AAGK97_05895, partial [Bacteroidota bacterium]